MSRKKINLYQHYNKEDLDNIRQLILTDNKDTARLGVILATKSLGIKLEHLKSLVTIDDVKLVGERGQIHCKLYALGVCFDRPKIEDKYGCYNDYYITFVHNINQLLHGI